MVPLVLHGSRGLIDSAKAARNSAIILEDSLYTKTLNTNTCNEDEKSILKDFFSGIELYKKTIHFYDR
jgi:hypothetical protein